MNPDPQLRADRPQLLKVFMQLWNDWFVDGHGISKYCFNDIDVRQDIERRYGFAGELLEIYAAGSPQLVHKWHHYIPIYDRYFSSWRGKPVRFLEIGVSGGGSLTMWRKYFGDAAIIYGIDIDERCTQFDGHGGRVRIGSQSNADFLIDVVTEMGGIDVILDDGSHKMRHIHASLEVLFPRLEEGGLYMIEDLHTAYWKGYGGGFWRKGNFFNYVRELVDDVHRWYHVYGVRHPQVSEHCSAIHLHDSICVIEKWKQQRPTHSRIQSGQTTCTDRGERLVRNK